MNFPKESWGPHPTSDSEKTLILPCVYGLQTTAQKKIYDRVRTGCKEKRAGSAKFVVFHLLIGLIAVAMKQPELNELSQTVLLK